MDSNTGQRQVANGMKLRHAATLALLLLASCGPTIKKSTNRAEAGADRTELSATRAQQAADQAFDASVRALKAEDQADKDARRASDAVRRLEVPRVAHGELLVVPTAGSPMRWCLMGPPIAQGCPDCSESVEWHAPLSTFWVGEIFDSKSDCQGAVRKFHSQFLRFGGKGLPFRAFCAACANEAADDEN